MTDSKTRRDENADATRAALLRGARDLFSKKGFHGTSVDEVCAQARVTKGALYHHFRNKDELFAGVVEKLESELIDEISAGALPSSGPWEQMERGIDVFLERCLDATYRRIVLSEAPGVLGRRQLAEIGERTAEGLLRLILSDMMEKKLIAKQPLEIAVRLLLSVLIEAGFLIGESANPQRTKRDVQKSIGRFLESLK